MNIEKVISELNLFKAKEKKLGVLISFLQILPSGIIFEILKDTDAYLKKWNLNKVPSIDKWLAFYDDEYLLFNHTLNHFKETWESSQAFRNFIFINIKFFQPVIPFIKKDIEENYPHFKKTLISYILDEVEKIDIQVFERTIAKLPIKKRKDSADQNYVLHFGIRIGFPCIYFFGETHYALFKKAKNGDIDSVCNLLRIDKSILREPTIAEIFHKASMDMESETYKKLYRAIGGKEKINSPKKFKEMLAAYTFQTSKSIGTNLTKQQIIDLVDDRARLVDPTVLQDLDFESPEAFKKSIQRKSTLYKNILPLDKN